VNNILCECVSVFLQKIIVSNFLKISIYETNVFGSLSVPVFLKYLYVHVLRILEMLKRAKKGKHELSKEVINNRILEVLVKVLSVMVHLIKENQDAVSNLSGLFNQMDICLKEFTLHLILD